MTFELIKEYLPYIGYIGTFYNIMKHAANPIKSLVDNYSVRMFDVGDIFNEVTEENIHVNSYLKMEGYLLKYGQVFKPYTHMNSVWSHLKEKDILEQIDIDEDIHIIGKNNNHTISEIKNRGLLFRRKRLWIPTQAIPPFGGIGCAFIYDSRFNGFVSNKDLSKPNDTNLLIDHNNKYAKPIIVLYDVNKHSQYLNKKVFLKAKLIEMPQDILSLLNIQSDKDIWEICSNFYRPMNENVNFICLSLLEDNSKINLVEGGDLCKNFDKLTIPLFVESNLDKLKNCDINKSCNFLHDILPNTISGLNPLYENERVALRGEGEEPICFPSTDEISVMFKEPGTVGFYTSTSLIDSEKFENDLSELSEYINNFAANYKKACNKQFGENDKLDISFLFDYNKKVLFKSRDSNISFSDEKLWNNQEKEVSAIIKWLGQ